MAYDRNCLMCGSHYEYCPHCAQYERLPRWMFTFDRIECKQLFEILGDYKTEHITKQEAREKIIALNISDIKFTDIVQRSINEVMELSQDELTSMDKLIEESDEIVEDLKNVETSLDSSRKRKASKRATSSRMKNKASVSADVNNE